MTLAELKTKAAELGLTPDDVRAFGSLARKSTWEDAISSHQPVQPQPTEVAVTVNQSSRSGWWHSTKKPFTTEDGNGVDFNSQPTVQLTVTPHSTSEPVQSSAIVPFRPNLTEICKPDNSGYLVWNDKTQNWVKERPSESSTPIRDKLLAKMMGYVGKGISLKDLEEMQLSSPDEHTAAIYLAILEESERMLIEAVAA